MAKYNVIFKCGHEEVVELYGKHKDRESRIEWYKNECNCSECRKKEYREKMSKTHDEVVMKYKDYKEKYYDCKALRGSYNDETKEIVVFVPQNYKEKKKITLDAVKASIASLDDIQKEEMRHELSKLFIEDFMGLKKGVPFHEEFTKDAWNYLIEFIGEKKQDGGQGNIC